MREMPILQTLVWGLVWLVEQISRCPHRQLYPGYGKFHCPDCGQGLVATWVILKCSGCTCRRNSKFMYGRVIPAENFCAACGTRETYLHHVAPSMGQPFPSAWLIWQDEVQYLAESQGTEPMRIWVDPPVTQPPFTPPMTSSPMASTFNPGKPEAPTKPGAPVSPVGYAAAHQSKSTFKLPDRKPLNPIFS